MINKIRALHPEPTSPPVDYDPSATRVNQENRIKLMLAVAKEHQRDKEEAQGRGGGRRSGPGIGAHRAAPPGRTTLDNFFWSPNKGMREDVSAWHNGKSF